MLLIKNLLFVAVAVSGLVIKRDAAQVKKDLQLINTDTQDVTAAVNNYNGGGLANAFPIVKAQQKLSKDIKTGTDNAKAAGVVSEADAIDIIAYINQTLQPSIQTTLSALKSKKPQFDSDGLTSTARASLKSLKADADNFSAALIAGAPPSKVSEAQAVRDALDTSFNDVVNSYS